MNVSRQFKTMSLWLLVLFFLLMGSAAGFAEQLGLLPGLDNPTCLAVDGDEVYVLDNHEVKVYSIKTKKLLRSFGSLGYGPGELTPTDEIPLQMQLFKDQVFVNSQTKFIHFSREGKVIKEKTIPFMCMQVLPAGKDYVVSRVGVDDNMKLYFRVVRFGSDFKKGKTLHTTASMPTLRTSAQLEPPSNFLYMQLSPGGEKLYVYSGRQEEFLVRVMDMQGKKLPPLKMDYTRPAWTAKFKKEVIRWFSTRSRFLRLRGRDAMVKKLLKFPAHLPALRNVLVVKDNIYVQTYKKKGALSEFFIFSPGGGEPRKVFLPDDSRYPIKMNPDMTFSIDHGRYYYLMEDHGGEEWQLHVAPVK